MSLDIKSIGSIIQDAQTLADRIRSQALSVQQAAAAVDAVLAHEPDVVEELLAVP